MNECGEPADALLLPQSFRLHSEGCMSGGVETAAGVCSRVIIALVSCSVQTNQLSFVHESCVLLEVSDDVSALLGVGDTSEGHCVTGGVIGWGLKVLVEGVVVPLLA